MGSVVGMQIQDFFARTLILFISQFPSARENILRSLDCHHAPPNLWVP